MKALLYALGVAFVVIAYGDAWVLYNGVPAGSKLSVGTVFLSCFGAAACFHFGRTSE